MFYCMIQKKNHTTESNQLKARSSTLHCISYDILSPGCPWSISEKKIEAVLIILYIINFYWLQLFQRIFTKRINFTFWYFHCSSLFLLQFYWLNLTHLDHDFIETNFLSGQTATVNYRQAESHFMPPWWIYILMVTSKPLGAPRLNQPFIIPRLTKWVPGSHGD